MEKSLLERFATCLPEPSGDVGLDLRSDIGYFKAKWSLPKWDEMLLPQQLTVKEIQRTIPVTHEQLFKRAQVEYHNPALRLLGKLYKRTVLEASSLGSEDIENVAIAVGMLAAAGLCDVDPVAVRLSNEGKEFVQSLIATE